ncbi:FG-GAP-like repeat-containing protein [Archangium violaceum]|uniref:FG-GAP-like repeat-containing protein n=1 Tax=Archangium violaceum TaxID=83451 RepID=UPI002B32447B|nr:FG-GAP-like repeat-containing protein [Archangium gephyra]
MSNRYPSPGSWAFLMWAGLIGGPALAEPSSNPSTSVDTYYGAFSTSELIAVPSFHGQEPSLRLTYSSTGGSGTAGAGWGLEGFSSIGRASAGKGTPRYDGGDLFLLDGQELVACTAGSSSPSCTTGGTHATRLESYQRIKFDAAANTWTMWRKDGSRQSYAPLFQTAQGTYRWGVSTVADTSGNTVQYGWWCDGSPVQECYPDSVSYNGTLVKLYREARPDPITYATGASTLATAHYRLKTVDVTTSGSRVRTYQLTYSVSTSSGRSLLQSVRQFGSDATLDGAGTVTGGSALPAKTFEYQTSPGGLTSTEWATAADYLGNDSYNYVVTGDFDGDGRTDIAFTRPQWNGWKMRLSTGAGFSSTDWMTAADHLGIDSTNYVVTGDFNGDGRTDIAFTRPQWNGWKMRLSTGNGFTSADWLTAADAMGTDGHNRIVTGDFNGDGRTDIAFTRPQWNNWKVRLSTGNGFTSADWTTAADAMGFDSYNHVVTGDFNGDGRTDIAFTRPQWNRWRMRLSTGSGFTSADWMTAADAMGNDSHNHVVTGDFNGDGRTDIAFTRPQWNNWKVRLSTGNGLTSADWMTAVDAMGNDGHNRVVTGDFDGDGRTDIAFTRPQWNGWKMRLSRGNGFASADWLTAADAMGTDGYNHVVVGDLNGDGKTDLAHTRPQWNAWRTRLSSGPIPDLLSTARNRQGGLTRVQYTPSSAWSNTYLPEGAILQTVSAITQEDGRGASSTTRYQYQGALWSASERRFLGFRKATAILDAAGNYTETYYHQHVGCISKPEVTYYRDASGNIFKYSTFGYTENAAPPYTSLMTERWEYECNQSASCRRTLLQIGYDTYGNGYLTYEHGDYDVAGDERTSLRGLVPNNSAYVVGLPAYENIYAGVGTGGSLLRQTLFEYDGSGNYSLAPKAGLLTRQLAWNNQTGGYSARGFGYDAWGNRTSETDPSGNTTTVTYDATYHLYPVSRCNALGQCSSQTWDGARALVKAETDLNGGVTRYDHDALSRPVRTTLPDGSVETFAYLDQGTPWLQRVRRTMSDGTADGLWMEAYEDGLGRRYRTVKEGGSTQETLYSNASNRAWKQSNWFGPSDTPRYQTFSYDGLGRLRTVTNPDGTSAQRVYGYGYIATYDELGQEKVTWTDAYGQSTQVRERNAGSYSYTSYQYDLLGNLVRVQNPAGHATTVTWDSLGRKLQGCDPDTGCTSYSYDAAGLMLSRRDAKGQLTSFTYDALGRVLTTTYSHGEQVRRIYDEAGRGASKGALTTQIDASGSESRSYDFAGRVTSSTKCVTGLCYTTGRAYDTVGRLVSVTYPDGEVVPYKYDASGNLLSVGGYASGLTYDAGGHLLSLSYGNGTNTTYAYDANRQWLASALVSGPSGTVYQASYSYDAKARVRGMSSSTHSQSNLGFSYDELDRLTGVSGGQSQAFSYDSLGNLTFNSQVGGYGYADSSHRHAVTAAGGSAYTYDANGNMTSGGGRSYSWDGDNRLTRVTQSSGSTDFTYDASGQRVKLSGPAGTTWFFGPHLEYGNNGLTKYYYAGPLLVARRDNSGVHWYHQDHLGSVRALTNVSGTRVASYEYSAFGVPVASASSVANTRGFTGHTADTTGLVYMGARYFDPVLGRFLSADSLVPSSHSPQALNRYTYVYNNPISNTDPTGHVPVVFAIATAASVGAAVGWTSAAFIIATVGAATVTTGYIIKDPMLMSIGSVLLGGASGFAFGVGYLSTAEPLMNAAIGGSMAALTSPVSPLDSSLKNALGWAYTAQNLLFEFNHLDERIQTGSDRVRNDLDGKAIEASKGQMIDTFTDEQIELMQSPEKWTSKQRMYGEAMERATGGALKQGEAIALNSSGGLVGPGDGLFAQVLDVTTGWIPGVRAHAVVHDLSGHLGTTFGVGKGYNYAGSWFGMSNSNPLAGQVEGILRTGGHSASALFQRLY